MGFRMTARSGAANIWKTDALSEKPMELFVLMLCVRMLPRYLVFGLWLRRHQVEFLCSVILIA